MGEEALDQGGPKREYWRLLAIDIMTKICIGSDDRLTLEHDVLGLQVNTCMYCSFVYMCIHGYKYVCIMCDWS